MTTPLRRRDPPPWIEPTEGIRSCREYQVGDCWYATPDGQGGWTMYPDGRGFNGDPAVNRHRLRIAPEHAGKVPIIVVLPSTAFPDGLPFCLHQPTFMGEWGPSGWTVQGGLENLSGLHVTPSLDVKGHCHVWIHDGQVLGC